MCYNNRAFGGVAQLGERTVRIRKVKGSNPSVSTMKETSFVYQDKRGFSCILGEKRVQIRNEGIVVEFKCGVAIEQEYVK